MSSRIVAWARDTTPQDNHSQELAAFVVAVAVVAAVADRHNHRIRSVEVEVPEQTREQELVPDIAFAVENTEVVGSAPVPGTLETLGPRSVHHTQKDLLLATGQGTAAAASAVEPMDRRQVVHNCQQEAVVPLDRQDWDSRQEPALRRQPLLTECPWTRVHKMFPLARMPSHQYRRLYYYPLKDRRRTLTGNVEPVRSCHLQDCCPTNNSCNHHHHRHHRFVAVLRSDRILFVVLPVTFATPLAVVDRGVP